MDKEIKFGFFKKHLVEKEEKFTFAFLSLLKKDTTKTKTYSKFQISSKGMEMLGLSRGTKNQTVAMSYGENKEMVILNTTGYADSKADGVSLVSKAGTFSYGKMYDKIVEALSFDINQENYLKMTLPTEQYTVNNKKLKGADLTIIEKEDTKLEITGDIKVDATDKLEEDFNKEVKEVEKIVAVNFDDVDDLEEDDEL